jgi:U3 small nucleolar RNA-associated protein 12
LRHVSNSAEKASSVVSTKISTMSMGGHPTGIRAVELSSDDALACTVSKNTTKIWNVKKRSCVQSLVPAVNNTSCYGLCTVFLPGNTHLVLGTREGHLLVIDVAAGDVVYVEENAHDGAIWCLDIRRPTSQQPAIVIVTGSADKTVKFWELETQEDSSAPMLVHSRTLEMSDDVIAVRYSHSTDPTKRMVFVSCLDSTIKVFFDDTLKFFLSLYGHKLPALAIDASDDDVILASSGADKTIKIWGLDFGDTHRTLHGHEDSVTDLRFVRRTHNFFTTSKDGTVRYWDGDRFEQILILNGHFAEVSCLSISRTGAFVMTGGLDRQVRVWERTQDIVFLEEERERELEQMFDGVAREEDATGRLLMKKGEQKDDDDDEEGDNEPQSEAAVKRSVLSVAAGDRIMEALERADQEKKDAAQYRKKNPGKEKTPNPLLLGMEPALYFLWVLKSVKQAELEQSLLVLPLGHVERVLYYLILLLRSGRGVEICARVSVFLVKTHQKQIMTSRSIVVPLRELRRLLRERLSESRDTIGFNLAALRAVARTTASKKEGYLNYNADQTKDIWAGMGLGSDLAAALEGSRKPGRR